jgi:8-oxo-dGTP pyrophosphatase MutT (NUDIX family)
VSDIGALLDSYAPRGPAEAADLARCRALARAEADPWQRSIPLHFTASALIVHPASRRVLLRWHERQQAWIQVGGHADAGERDPAGIALREGAEETGLADLVPWPGPGLLHLTVVSAPARGAEPAHEHADLRFVLATADPGAARPEHPQAPLRWLTLPGARALTTEANVHESLDRLDGLLGQAPGKFLKTR